MWVMSNRDTMNLSVFFFCYQETNSLGAIVVNLVCTYLTRGIEDSV